jgi:hypothetical protein
MNKAHFAGEYHWGEAGESEIGRWVLDSCWENARANFQINFSWLKLVIIGLCLRHIHIINPCYGVHFLQPLSQKPRHHSRIFGSGFEVCGNVKAGTAESASRISGDKTPMIWVLYGNDRVDGACEFFGIILRFSVSPVEHRIKSDAIEIMTRIRSQDASHLVYLSGGNGARLFEPFHFGIEDSSALTSFGRLLFGIFGILICRGDFRADPIGFDCSKPVPFAIYLLLNGSEYSVVPPCSHAVNRFTSDAHRNEYSKHDEFYIESRQEGDQRISLQRKLCQKGAIHG